MPLPCLSSILFRVHIWLREERASFFELSDSPFHSPPYLTTRLRVESLPDISNSPPVGNAAKAGVATRLTREPPDGGMALIRPHSQPSPGAQTTIWATRAAVPIRLRGARCRLLRADGLFSIRVHLGADGAICSRPGKQRLLSPRPVGEISPVHVMLDLGYGQVLEAQVSHGAAPLVVVCAVNDPGQEDDAVDGASRDPGPWVAIQVSVRPSQLSPFSAPGTFKLFPLGLCVRWRHG